MFYKVINAHIIIKRKQTGKQEMMLRTTVLRNLLTEVTLWHECKGIWSAGLYWLRKQTFITMALKSKYIFHHDHIFNKSFWAHDKMTFALDSYPWNNILDCFVSCSKEDWCFTQKHQWWIRDFPMVGDWTKRDFFGIVSENPTKLKQFSRYGGQEAEDVRRLYPPMITFSYNTYILHYL